MKKANIAVFVSGGGTNLQALIDAQKNGIITSGSIKLVISNSEKAFALERASKNQIDNFCILKSKCKTQECFESEIIKKLNEYNIDIIVLAGFMSILSADFTRRYPERILNIHPSLIPSFCGKGFYGLHVHEAALSYGVKVTGATVHYVNEIPDGGKIIKQKAVYIEDGDSPEILQKRVMEQAEWIILPEAVELVSKKILLLK